MVFEWRGGDWWEGKIKQQLSCRAVFRLDLVPLGLSTRADLGGVRRILLINRGELVGSIVSSVVVVCSMYASLVLPICVAREH
jgi:hypothetical protein